VKDGRHSIRSKIFFQFVLIYGKTKCVFIVETLSEDEEDDIIVGASGEGVSITAMPFGNSNTNFTPTPGGPFSALTPSMWPQDIISRINHPVIAFLLPVKQIIWTVLEVCF
jgi:hypothetical protein